MTELPLILALNLTLPLDYILLTGAEQAGEMTASCRMQADTVACITVSPASVPLCYSEITKQDKFYSST